MSNFGNCLLLPLKRFASSGNANPVTLTVVLGQKPAARTGKRKAVGSSPQQGTRKAFPCCVSMF